MNKKSIRYMKMHTMKTIWSLRMSLWERKKTRLLCRLMINKTRISLILITSLNHSSWNAEHIINFFSLTTSYTSIFDLTVIIIWWRLHWILIKSQINQRWKLCQSLCNKLWCCWICLFILNLSSWINSIQMNTDFKTDVMLLQKQNCH